MPVPLLLPAAPELLPLELDALLPPRALEPVELELELELDGAPPLPPLLPALGVVDESDGAVSVELPPCDVSLSLPHALARSSTQPSHVAGLFIIEFRSWLESFLGLRAPKGTHARFGREAPPCSSERGQ